MENTAKTNQSDKALHDFIAGFFGSLVGIAAISAGFHFLAPASVAKNSAWVMLLLVLCAGCFLPTFVPKKKYFLTTFSQLTSYLLWMGFIASLQDWHFSYRSNWSTSALLLVLPVWTLPSLFNNPLLLRAIFEIKDTPKPPLLFAFFKNPRYPFWAINAIAFLSLYLMYRQTTLATHVYLVVLALVSMAAIWLTPATEEQQTVLPSTSALSPQ